MTEPSTCLVKNTTVRQLVLACNDAERAIRASFQAIVEAESALNSVYGTTEADSRISIDVHSCRFDDVDPSIVLLERQCWRRIVERLELRRLLSIKRWDELSNELERGKLPRITEANVQAFARSYSDNIQLMHDEAIREIFNWLRPHRSEYKTNSEFEIGPKVILENVVTRQYWSRGFRVYGEHYAQRLLALENVFNALGGMGMIAKQYRSAVQNSIEGTDKCIGETELFVWKAYKNGNLHLEFKRLDLLALLNRKAGGLNLRG